MSTNRNIFSNDFGPNTQIHQGDIHYHSSNASRKAYYVLPFPPNEDVIRRPEVVTKLDGLMSPSKEGRYCDAALWGLSGSGKTQIALDYAYRRSHEDPECDIFWVHADNEASFVQDYQAVARMLGLNPVLNGEELFLEVRKCIESQRKWLLILDNADDVTRFGIGATDHTKSLLKFIPRGPGGTVLWTSCDKQILALVGPRRGIQITHMSIEEAEKLLSVARDEDIRDDEIQDARLLLQELQWLPLAISQAGSFMWRTSTSINKYLSRLLEGKSRWDTLKKTQYDKYRRPEVSNSILETWDISIRYIEQESSMAYKILHAIAYIDNQNIPLSVILAISARFDQLGQKTTKSEDILETVIIRLKEFSFISARKAENYSEPTFDMHKLVQDAIRYTFNTGNVTGEPFFFIAALSALTKVFPKEVKRETWSLCEKYATHAIEVSEWAGKMLDIAITASDLLGRVAEYFRECGFLKKAEYTAKKELRLARISATQTPTLVQVPAIAQRLASTTILTLTHDTAKLTDLSQRRILLALSRLSRIYRTQKLFEEAESYALEALVLAEKTLGEKHVVTVTYMSLLVDAYTCQGQFKKAEELQMKQVSFLQETCGEKHLYTISAMNNLAWIYDQQKLYDKAKELKVQALSLSNEVFGESHPFTIEFIWSLASTYRWANQDKEASELETKILFLKKESQREERPMIRDLEKLATIYAQQSQFGKVKGLQKRILSVQQDAFGETHLSTILAMQNLAEIHLLEKEFKEAEELHLRALTLLQGTFGDKNERTIMAMRYVAQLYYTQNLTEKGEEFRKKGISLMMEMYNNNPPPRLLLQFEDIASLSMRRSIRLHQVKRCMPKLYPLIERRLHQRISRIRIKARRLKKQVLLVMLEMKVRLLKQRLLKFAKQLRLIKRRLLKLAQFRGRKLMQHRRLIQSLLERRILKLCSVARISLDRYQSKLLSWRRGIIERHQLKTDLWLRRLLECIDRHMNSCRD